MADPAPMRLDRYRDRVILAERTVRSAIDTLKTTPVDAAGAEPSTTTERTGS